MCVCVCVCVPAWPRELSPNPRRRVGRFLSCPMSLATSTSYSLPILTQRCSYTALLLSHIFLTLSHTSSTLTFTHSLPPSPHHIHMTDRRADGQGPGKWPRIPLSLFLTRRLPTRFVREREEGRRGREGERERERERLKTITHAHPRPLHFTSSHPRPSSSSSSSSPAHILPYEEVRNERVSVGQRG